MNNTLLITLLLFFSLYTNSFMQNGPLVTSWESHLTSPHNKFSKEKTNKNSNTNFYKNTNEFKFNRDIIIHNLIDSVITTDEELKRMKYTYTYNDSSLIESILKEREWAEDKWVYEWRYYYTYDENGNTISYLAERWWNNQWIKYYNYLYTYDANIKLTSETRKGYISGEWIESEKFIKNYNSDGNIIEYYYQSGGLNAWRYVYDYNSSEKITEEIVFSWINNEWERIHQTTNEFDYNGDITSALIEELVDGIQWMNGARFTYNYDSNRFLVMELEEVWLNNQWEGHYRHTYQYDLNGNKIQTLREEWKDSEWAYDNKIINSYDSEGRLISIIEQGFHWSGNGWVDLWRESFTYDNNANILTILLEQGDRFFSRQIFSYGLNNDLTKYEYNNWDITDSSWKIFYKNKNPISFEDMVGNSFSFTACEIELYSSYLTNMNDENFFIFDYHLSQNYPNPFNPSTSISYSIPQSGIVKLTLFDILGSEVKSIANKFQNAGNYTIKLDASNLSNGVYFYRFEINDYLDVKKLLIIK